MDEIPRGKAAVALNLGGDSGGSRPGSSLSAASDQHSVGTVGTRRAAAPADDATPVQQHSNVPLEALSAIQDEAKERYKIISALESNMNVKERGTPTTVSRTASSCREANLRITEQRVKEEALKQKVRSELSRRVVANRTRQRDLGIKQELAQVHARFNASRAVLTQGTSSCGGIRPRTACQLYVCVGPPRCPCAHAPVHGGVSGVALSRVWGAHPPTSYRARRPHADPPQMLSSGSFSAGDPVWVGQLGSSSLLGCVSNTGYLSVFLVTGSGNGGEDVLSPAAKASTAVIDDSADGVALVDVELLTLCTNDDLLLHACYLDQGKEEIRSAAVRGLTCTAPR